MNLELPEISKIALGLINPTIDLAHTATVASGFGGTIPIPGMPKLPDLPGASNSNSHSNLIGIVLLVIALYLALKCKTDSGGIDILQLILAWCCTPCYIVYRLLNPC